MKGEYVFQKGVAKTIVFPLIAPGSDEYYTGGIGFFDVDAYKYGQSNTPTSITISGTPTQLGSTGLFYLTLSTSETDIGDDYEYIVVKISDQETGDFKEQTVILSSAVRMNHLSIEHDDPTEPAVTISGADGASSAGIGLSVTGGNASNNGVSGADAILATGGNGATGGTNGNGGDAIRFYGGQGKGSGDGGSGVRVFSGTPDGIGVYIEGFGSGGKGVRVEANTGIDVQGGDAAISLIADVGIDIDSNDNGIDVSSGGSGIRILSNDESLSIESITAQGVLVEGAANFAAVELRGSDATGSDDGGEGLLITGGEATGTGASGSAVRVVGGDGGGPNAAGHGIAITGGASDDGAINAGHGILASAGSAVTAGGAGIKAVATGDGIDLDADNLQPIQDIPNIETKIDTVDSNVDAILVDTGTTIPASITAIDGKIDTVDTVVDGIATDITTIDSNVDTIVGKLPAGNISGFELTDTIDGVAVSEIFEYMMAMFNGRYLIDTPSAGDITFYKRDNVTLLSTVNRTNAGRTRL